MIGERDGVDVRLFSEAVGDGGGGGGRGVTWIAEGVRSVSAAAGEDSG